jgi:molecular chaperone GrpE
MHRDDENHSAANSTTSTSGPSQPRSDGSGARLLEVYEQKLAKLMQESQCLNDRLLRTAAELENTRKRSKRDVAEAERRGREAVFQDFVPVLDSLELALRTADPGPLTTGVRLVEKQLLGALEKFGVFRFSARGLKFDPSVHEAIEQRPTGALEPGMVAEEFTSGYVHQGRLLRPARVAVAAAPAAAELTPAKL